MLSELRERTARHSVEIRTLNARLDETLERVDSRMERLDDRMAKVDDNMQKNAVILAEIRAQVSGRDGVAQARLDEVSARTKVWLALAGLLTALAGALAGFFARGG